MTPDLDVPATDPARHGQLPRRLLSLVPTVAIVLAMVVGLACVLLVVVHHFNMVRATGLADTAERLTEKHGVTFEPLETVDRHTNLRRWSIDGRVLVCETQSVALVCTNGSTFER